MVSRRGTIGGVAAIISVGMAGCISTNTDVVESYERGYVLYHEAEDNDGDLREILFLYEQSARSFDEAKVAANNDTVEKYCYEARELARMEASATANKIEEQESEKGEDDDDDDDEGITWDAPEYEVIDASDYREDLERLSVANYEMRSPSTVEQRTRIPF